MTQRHFPPTRKSTSAIVATPRFACHHCLMSSGVVYTLNTKCFGASNSRVMRMCESVGSVTTAVLLLATAISFPPLEILQHFVHCLETLSPHFLVALHPVVDGLQGAAVEPVEPLTSVLTHDDQAHLAQHFQV